MALTSPNTKQGRTDPLKDFKFRVAIVPHGDPLAKATVGIQNLGFAVMGGISVQNEMIAYREGGMNTNPHKMIGQSDFAPVTFSRGVYAGPGNTTNPLWGWQQFMHSWQQGLPNGSNPGEDYRADITVDVMDHPITGGNYTYDEDPAVTVSAGTPAPSRLRYTLYNAWPGGYSLGDLNAGSSSLLIQQMTVHFEGFTLDFAPN